MINIHPVAFLYSIVAVHRINENLCGQLGDALEILDIWTSAVWRRLHTQKFLDLIVTCGGSKLHRFHRIKLELVGYPQ